MPHDGSGDDVKTVVLFDGFCNLCNKSINWIIDRDPASRIRFVPLQSVAGEAMAQHVGLDPKRLTTMVAVRSGSVMIRSDAALNVSAQLETPLARLAWAVLLVPAVLRDVGYRVLARSRYVLFGKLDSCRVPTPDLASRFLDPDDIDGAFCVAGLSVPGDSEAYTDTAATLHASPG